MRDESFPEEEIVQDRLLGGRVLLYQPKRGYRAAIDPVLLAAFCPGGAGERVLDAGCGAGAAMVCLAARLNAGAAEMDLTGIEFDPMLCSLAQRNLEENGLKGRILCGDFLQGGGAMASPVAGRATGQGTDWEGAGPYDQILINPPYLEAQHADPSPLVRKAAADVEVPDAGLADWVDRAHGLLRAKGRLTMVHRADRLPELLAALVPRFGEIAVLPLWPKAGRPAKRVLVSARRDLRAPALLLPGLVLHEPDGKFTPEAEKVLRHAAALEGVP